jgi:hypothetical protein
MRLGLLGLLLALSLAVVPSEAAPAADLPIRYQAVFLLRVLAFDRRLKVRTPDAASIVIVYQGGDDSSESVKNALTGEIDTLAKDVHVADLPIRVTSVAYRSPNDLEATIGRAKASALYLCPGLDSSVPIISTVTRRRSVLSFTSVESWLRQSISIGLVARGEKPAVVVNLAASKAEGAELDPALLRLSEVMR